MLGWAREGGVVIYDVYAETGRVRALWMGAGDLRRRAEGYPERALADYLAAGVDDADGVLEESWTLKYIAYLGPQMSPFPAEEKVARWREEMQKQKSVCARTWDWTAYDGPTTRWQCWPAPLRSACRLDTRSALLHLGSAVALGVLLVHCVSFE